ncbi:MAG: serine--tRNA ligase [Gemmatimonadota bacterium]|nr:MAG: serine--tRNA ligase [Gemmatimonadota bacterium]
MLDPKFIRNDPDSVREGLKQRAADELLPRVDEILELDAKRRAALNEVNELKAERNEVSQRIGDMKKQGDDAADLIAEMRRVGDRIGELDAEVARAEAGIQEILLVIPNLPLDEVPRGGEEANVIARSWGEPKAYDFELQPHWDLGAALDILDPARGAKLSGSGFPILKGDGARLQRGLINWMLALHTGEHGYLEVRVPYLVTAATLTATGQLPKFADESYASERDDLWLIPTAEVPVTNLHRDELLAPDDVPLKYVAYSPCFRREAGAAGKDTRGLLRVHQFDKVELVRFETPERSRQALEEMTADAEKVLQLLNLPYRVVVLASGDLGFSSAMTYDIEVWAPGVEQWLEVSSVSTCTDYQARRGNIRFRPAHGEKPEFVHTLNGSALALPRLMIALLESYQQPDGSVRIPEIVQPFVGLEAILP